MTLKASFVYKNPDSTRDLNARLRRVISRGIVWGGTMSPGVGLTVQVTPLVAVGFDGMTVEEDAVKTLTVVGGGTKQYVVVHARYNEGGVPATPTLVWRVLTSAAYLADPEKDYLIVVGTVTPMGGAVLMSEINLTERDEVDPLGRDWYRGVVPNPAALPGTSPMGNRVGDFFFVISDHTFYFWNGTIWEPLNTGSYNSETFVMNRGAIDAEQARFVEGSGVIAGIRPNQLGDFASDTEVNIIETPAVADQIGIDAFTAYVNGHRVQTHGQYLSLAAKPGIGTRYDIVYLEVWREAIVVPETHVYDRNPDGSTTYTLQAAEDKLESLSWLAGIPAAPAADNFNLNPVDGYNHDWRVVKWRLATVQNLPSSVALYNPSDPTISGICGNYDSSGFFASQPAGAGTDDRLWVSVAPASADGYSWAIPLLVIRRTSAEVVPNAVQIFRDGVRHVFPVYPVADVSHSARKALDTAYRSEPTPITLDQNPFGEPSGFLSGMNFQIETKVGSDNVSVFDEQVHVRIRDLDDWILPSFVFGSVVGLPTAPAFVNEWARQLIYLKMNITLYDDAPNSAATWRFVSSKHRPYIPSYLFGNVRGQGWKRGYVTFEFVMHDFGNTDYLDEHDAMTAAGWTRGDLTMASKNAQYEDGGIWSRAIPIDNDDRVHPYLTEWAIPVCLIHRRNSAAWNPTTNPNGSGAGRPDGRINAAWMYPDDLVDLRHEVGMDEEDVRQKLTADLSKAMRGQLRTRMANKYLGHGTGGIVAGSRILQTDFIGAVPGAYNMPPGDYMRRIWSDAREFHVVACTFELIGGGPIIDPLFEYSYDGGNQRGTLTIKAPPYAYIVRHTPALVLADGNSGTNFMEFAGPPLWTSQHNLVTEHGIARPASAKYLDTNVSPDNPQDLPFYWAADMTTATTGVQGFIVTNKDPVSGNALEMTGYIDTSGIVSGEAVLSWWIHYDRTFAGSISANYGLAEIPDEVHSVTLDPFGAPEQVNVGTLYTVVEKASLVGVTSITVTAADVSAASGLPGTVTLVGLGNALHGSTLSVSSVTMSAAARDSITVHLAAPYTGNYQVEVFFRTDDVSKWVEIGRGGKSVQAYFEWYEYLNPNLGAEPAPVATRGIKLDNDVMTPVQVCGRMAEPYFVWTKTAAAVDWTLAPSTNMFSTQLTNFMAINQSGLNQQALVIVPVHKTFSPLDTLQLDYTYTPYQGVSTPSGASPVIAPPLLTNMKGMLHGTIVDNTEVVVTQNGASSYFSGVESWTGLPVNRTGPSLDTCSGGSARCEWYNNTVLVKPIASTTALQLDGILEAKRGLLSSPVLRLPFPQNTAMMSFSYHLGVMDFDLDPLRAGVGAGTFSYAPGYYGGPVDAIRASLRKDQFVNGLSKLLERGYAPGDAKTSAFMGSSWQVTTEHAYVVDRVNPVYSAWITPTADVLAVTVDLPEAERSLLKRIQNLRFGYQANVLHVTSPDRNGLQVYGSRSKGITAGLPAAYALDISAGAGFTYVFTSHIGHNERSWYLSIQPGAILNYYKKWVDPSILVILGAKQGMALPGSDTRVISTIVQSEEEEWVVNTMAYGMPSLHASWKRVSDTVTFPFEPASSTNVNNVNSSDAGPFKDVVVEYPPAWSPGTITALEGLYAAPSDIRGAGRGIYLGTSEVRKNMPVLVPGSGDPLVDVLRDADTYSDPEGSPTAVPFKSQTPPFAPTHKHYYHYDHGGQIAYSCFALGIRPSSDEYKNTLMMQVTGGPIGKIGDSYDIIDPTELDGTALDAFWPTGRPILKSKK